MSPRKGHIRPAINVSLEAIADAIERIREALDVADYHSDTVVSTYLIRGGTTIEQTYAWMMAALLIADAAEIDSMTLRELQNSIWKGARSDLF